MKIKMFFLTTAFITQSTYASELPVIPLRDLVNAAALLNKSDFG